jgi:hypothetical protein
MSKGTPHREIQKFQLKRGKNWPPDPASSPPVPLLLLTSLPPATFYHVQRFGRESGAPPPSLFGSLSEM